MKKVKVIEHGYFFKNGYLKTQCKCGCVYLTSAKNVLMREDSFDLASGTYFQTYCPECEQRNKQYLQDLRKEMEVKNER